MAILPTMSMIGKTFKTSVEIATGAASAFKARVFSAPSIVLPLPPNIFQLTIDPVWYASYSEEWKEMTGGSNHLRVTFGDFEGGISESAEVDYAEIGVVGRPEQYKIYQSTTNREIPFTFQFQVQGTSTLKNAGKACYNEVVAPARWLEALKYPVIRNGLTISPPPLILQIGELIHHRVILTQCACTWKPPFDPATMNPHNAEVQCTFTVVRRNITNKNTFRSN